MDDIPVREQIIKISTMLADLQELLTQSKIHLAPAQAMLIKEESQKLASMIWRVEPWNLTD